MAATSFCAICAPAKCLPQLCMMGRSTAHKLGTAGCSARNRSTSAGSARRPATSRSRTSARTASSPITASPIPRSGGQYTVTVRGFDVGDNTCTCPDFKANTLGTCKHVEAVLDHSEGRSAGAPPAEEGRGHAAGNLPPLRRAAAARPPPAARHSDKLARLAGGILRREGALDRQGEVPRPDPRRRGGSRRRDRSSPTRWSSCDREIERAEMLAREQEWLAATRSRHDLDLNLLNVPLYDYQTARRAVPRLPRPQHPRRRHGPRQDGPDARGRRVARPRTRRRARARRRAGVGEVPVGIGDPRSSPTGRCRSIEGGPDDRRDQYAAADVLPARQLRAGRARSRSDQRLEAGRDRARRGPAHQELGIEDLAGSEETPEPLRDRADRHAAGEQARRTLQHRAVRGRPPLRPGVPVPARSPRARRERQPEGLPQPRQDSREARADLPAANARRGADAAARRGPTTPSSSNSRPSSAGPTRSSAPRSRGCCRRTTSPISTASGFSRASSTCG